MKHNIKTFTESRHNINDEIDEWLKDNQMINIISINQSSCYTKIYAPHGREIYITITIYYKP